MAQGNQTAQESIKIRNMAAEGNFTFQGSLVNHGGHRCEGKVLKARAVSGQGLPDSSSPVSIPSITPDSEGVKELSYTTLHTSPTNNREIQMNSFKPELILREFTRLRYVEQHLKQDQHWSLPQIPSAVAGLHFLPGPFLL